MKKRGLGLIYSYTCNISCAHCCLGCGPNRTEKMDFERTKEILVLLKDHIHSVNISGGEMFLFYDELLDLVKLSRILGVETSCVTNGFWGENDTMTNKYIYQLKKAGLGRLVLSYDEFHAPYVSSHALSNIIREATKNRIDVLVQATVTKTSKRLSQLLESLDGELFEIYYSEVPCFPAGRASENIKIDDFYVTYDASDTRCSGLGNNIVVLPNGDILPCCSPMAPSIAGLRIGNLFSSDIEQILSAYNKRDFVNIRRYGFKSSVSNTLSLCELCKEHFNTCNK